MPSSRASSRRNRRGSSARRESSAPFDAAEEIRREDASVRAAESLGALGRSTRREHPSGRARRAIPIEGVPSPLRVFWRVKPRAAALGLKPPRFAGRAHRESRRRSPPGGGAQPVEGARLSSGPPASLAKRAIGKGNPRRATAARCELVPPARSSFGDLRPPAASSPSPSPTAPASSAHAHVNVERHFLSSVQPGKNLGRVVRAPGASNSLRDGHRPWCPR
jgi:hypothetical protein